MIGKLFIIAICFLIISQPLYAIEQQKILTPLERQEQIQNMDELGNNIDQARTLLEAIKIKNKGQCLKAIGNPSFCECMSNKLPTSINFIQYVAIVSQDKESLNYDKLSSDEKGIVDTTRKARDACIK